MKWQQKPISDVFALKQGTYLQKEEMQDVQTDEFSFPVYGANGVVGYSKRMMYAERTPLISCRGANCGVVHLTEPNSWVGNNSIACIPKNDADQKFFFYQFSHSLFTDVITGSAQPQITLTNLSPKLVFVPPSEVQRRIAFILSAYDDAIENNRRRMGLLEKAARLLYEEWFVRLRFPGHEHTPVKNGLPQGWKKGHIGDFVESGMVDIQTGPFGTQLKASDYTEEGTPVINVRNIGYGDLRPDKLEYVPEDIADRLSVHLLREGDIVFRRKGAVDRHILVSSSQSGWMQGSDCIRLRSLSDEVCPVLLTFAFREPSHHQWMLTQCGNKATMPSLNQGVISRIPTIVPTKIILAEFRSFAADCLNQITNLKTQNQKLRAARDLLLPRLMSGEIEV